MKLKLYNVRGEEAVLAKKWADDNGIEISLTESPLTPETVKEAEGFDGIANAQIGPLDDAIYPLLKEMGIKQIAQRSAGVDMYNLDLATENDIIITNVPSYSPESIAEFTVTIALNLIRHVELIRENVKKQNFTWGLPIRGRVLGDMTVAIIGTGRIGLATAKIFKGFGRKVVGYDIYQSDAAKAVLDYKESVEEAIKDADLVSLHMPPTAENTHLFNSDLFKSFKKGAILMNMARGAVIETQDLLDALDAGLLSGAGIDTYEFEGPYIPKNFEGQEITDSLFKALINHPKVIYTPHAAYYTDEAVKNLVEGALNATLALRTGHHNQDDVLNSLLAAGDAIKANWRASQWEIFDTLLDLGIYEEYFDQQRLGKQLSLSSSALSKRLKSSHVKIYLRTRQSALNCLKQIKEEADD
ncbi:TPA: SatD family protein [Streptococcus pyogenes]